MKLSLGLDLASMVALGSGVPWWLAPSYLLDGQAPGIAADFGRDRYAINGAPKSASDVLTLSSGAKWIINASREVVQSPANAPAFDFSTGSRRLLRECSSTNLMIKSNMDTSSGWNAINGSLLAGVASPYAAENSKVWMEDGTNSAHQIYCAFSTASYSATTYALSFFVKANGRTRFGIRTFYSASTNFIGAHFDLSSKTATMYAGSGSTATNIDAGVIELANGWCRVYTIFTVPSVIPFTAIRPWMWDGVATIDALNGLPSYTGDPTKGIYIWGFQVEQGALVTSYIPTTTAAVNRVTDVCQLTPAAAAVLQGSAATVAWRGNVLAAVSAQPIIGLGGGNSLIRGDGGGPSYILGDGSTSALTLTFANVIPGQIGVAYGWDASGRSGSANGSAIATDANTVDRSLASIFLGGSGGMLAGSAVRDAELVAWPARGANASIVSQARAYA